MNSFSRKTGSALLVTLLVVSLLLTLVMAFVVVVRVELRKVSAHQEQLQARAVARLGAELAVARLQELAGPDRRVSATADLFRGGAGNVYRSALSPHPRHRHWAGVWDGTGYDGADPSAKPFLGWLVSGDGSEDLETVAGAPATDAVPLVGSGSVAAADDEVWVRPHALPGTQGAFAWWVADEGGKARFNLQDPFRGTDDFVERQYSMKAAQRHGAEVMTYDDATPLAQANLYPLDNASFNASRGRLVFPAQLPLLGADGSPANTAYRELARRRFHDLTLHSAGVLANVREGGLKRDLSLAFEMPLAEFNASEFGGGSPHAEQPVYRPPGYPAHEAIAPLWRVTDFTPFGFQPENSPDRGQWSAADNEWIRPEKVLAPVFRGPPWHFFRNFHRLYKDVDPDRAAYGLESRSHRQQGGRQVYLGRSLYPTTNGFFPLRRYGQDAYTWTYAEDYGEPGRQYTTSRELGRPIFPGVAPVITRVQLVYSARTERRVDPDTSAVVYNLDLYIDPIVTLWNPYNVPLAVGGTDLPLQVSVRFLEKEFELRHRVGASSQTVRRTLGEMFRAAAPDNVYDHNLHESFQLTLLPNGLVMEPGEVVLLSVENRAVDYIRIPPTDRFSFSGVNLNMQPGVQAFWPVDTGIRLLNPFGVELAPEAELQFRVNRVGFAKFQAAAVNRTGSSHEPFFTTFEASIHHIATAWTDERPADDPSLHSRKMPVMMFDAQLRHENSSLPLNLLTHFNPRAMTYEQGTHMNMEATALRRDVFQEDMWLGFGARVDSWNGLVANHGARGAYWGGSNQASGGSPFVTLFEVPRLPPLSLAALQHAQVTYMADDPAFPLGNSFAPAFTRPGEKLSLQQLNNRNSGSGDARNQLLRWGVGAERRRTPLRQDWTMLRPDLSYWLNEALWDGYFFSGITPDAAGGSSATRFAAFQNGEPLPNATLRYRDRGLSPAAVRAGLFTPGGDILRDAPARAAEHLLVEGAFNVNSTSVEAWRALLASTRNLILNLQNRPEPVSVSGTAFTRTALPFDFENDRWHGFRNLTDAQIDRLAREIAREVRARGPFLNLGDFVNRRLAPAGHASQRAGPLQAAIDAAGLNSAFDIRLADRGFNPANLNPWLADNFNPQSPVAQTAPGYLTQADLLQVIGPLLTPRSDTFRVRAHGNHNGAVAWCELVVQRVPEYLDPADRPSAAPDALLPVNTRFGRRFEVISFRWLGPEEI